MNNVWTWFVLAVSLLALSQNSVPTSAPDSGVIIAAVSRDARMLGMGGQKPAKNVAFIEPLARLTPSREWQNLPCFADSDGKKYLNQNDCLQFGREYLSKPHTYTVVSAEGRSATINAGPTTLSECFGYTGTGTYAGGETPMAAIAASSTDIFSDSPAPQLLSNAAAKPLIKSFAAAVPGGLDSTLALKVLSLRLEGQEFLSVQRGSFDAAGTKLIFAIGKKDQGQFQIVQWKENTGDEDEAVLGTVHLTNGRDFLITTVTDPEGQWFRVYGMRHGKLVRVYSGGGSSC